MMHAEEIFLHSDLFGHLKDERFFAQDAAEYLEISANVQAIRPIR